MRSFRSVATLALLAGTLVLGGCQLAHYRVTDTSSDKTYYTTNQVLTQSSSGHRIKFTDAKSGKKVTIYQTFDIEVITAGDFETAVGMTGNEVASIYDQE